MEQMEQIVKSDIEEKGKAFGIFLFPVVRPPPLHHSLRTICDNLSFGQPLRSA